ncbi:MAG: hypothetical protein RLZZ09_477 [Pseudomonadota bacterium]|jgi:hypothetical protein
MKVWVMQGYGQREPATVRPWRKVNGPRLEGWELVEFLDGGQLVIHASGLEVRQ